MKKIFIIFTLCLLFVAAIFVAPTIFNTPVYAENSELLIDLNKNPTFAVYKDLIAYTSNNTIHIAKDNKIISSTTKYPGTCIDIAINEDHALLLYTHDGVNNLILYSFTFEESAEPIKEVSYPKDENQNGRISALTTDDVGNFWYTISPIDTIIAIVKISEIATDASAQIWGFDHFDKVTNFTIVPNEHNKSIYVIANNELYYSNGSGSYTKLPLAVTPTSVCILNNQVFLNTSDGVFVSNLNENNFVKLGSTLNNNSKIGVSSINELPYLFILKDNAIIQYAITENEISYYNKFDNSAFIHPTEFNDVKVVKLHEHVKIYTSPKNYQIKTTANADEYLLLLTTYNDESTQRAFYYVATKNNDLGYISIDTTYEEVLPNEDVTTIKVGAHAQALHRKINVYAYPFASNDFVSYTVDRFTTLVVDNNVAQIEDEQVWGYYQVSFVKDGDIVSGFVKSTDVSPYCELPTAGQRVLKYVKVKTASAGQTISLYSLPSEKSKVLDNVVDGVKLELAEEFDETSTWTKVKYNNSYAYVLTKNIQKDGLTSLQITIIVIACVVFLSTLLMVIFLVRRRRFGY